MKIRTQAIVHHLGLCCMSCHKILCPYLGKYFSQTGNGRCSDTIWIRCGVCQHKLWQTVQGLQMVRPCPVTLSPQVGSRVSAQVDPVEYRSPGNHVYSTEMIGSELPL